eukprot:2562716-Rhodomonas_salina.3
MVIVLLMMMVRVRMMVIVIVMMTVIVIAMVMGGGTNTHTPSHQHILYHSNSKTLTGVEGSSWQIGHMAPPPELPETSSGRRYLPYGDCRRTCCGLTSVPCSVCDEHWNGGLDNSRGTISGLP